MNSNEKYKNVIICLILTLVIFTIYWQVTGHDFISYDDNVYVTENPHVQEELSKRSILWAFSFHHETGSTYWHPLTWLSHILDYQFFGLDAGRYHFSNLLFHVINTILLFLLLKRVTGAVWRSAMVAALFAVHPVNVDSVAWIAERKNLLSTLFWILTMWCYSFYAERPGISRYILTCAAFILGLLAKPMLATLPFVLLLFDYWPLRRTGFSFDNATEDNHVTFRKSTFSRLIVEKLPLMALSCAAIYISSLELKTGGHLIPYSIRPLGLRIANFLDSYVSYIEKYFWPTDLTILYPYPTVMPPTARIVFAVLLLIVITVIAVTQIKRRPFLIVGWLWFLGTLVPVSGIIQGGVWPAMADRWAYVPFIGLYILFVWGISLLIPDTRLFKTLKAGGALSIILIMAVVAWIQTGYWKNDITLFSHAVEITDDNYIAHNNLGHALENEHDYQGAVHHYAEAFRIKPDNMEIGNNLGVVLAKAGRTEAAIAQFKMILEKDPSSERTLLNLGTACAERGQFEKASEYFQEALRLHGDSAEVYFGLGTMLVRQGNNREAVEQYLRALEINPRHISARVNLANALVRISRIDDAIDNYGKVLRINPNHAKVKNNLQVLLSDRKALDDRIANLRAALEAQPDSPVLLYNLGLAHQKRGYPEKALTYYERALGFNKGLTEAHQNISLIYSQWGDYEKARASLLKIIDLQPGNAAVYYNIACTYAMEKDAKRSIEWLEKALDKGFSDWNLIETDRDLDAIRGSSAYGKFIESHRRGE